jgi:hypothetical protein
VWWTLLGCFHEYNGPLQTLEVSFPRLMFKRIHREAEAGAQPEIQVHLIDLEAARRYFAELESLAREARCSRNPRVVLCALKVVAQQRSAIDSKFVLGGE